MSVTLLAIIGLLTLLTGLVVFISSLVWQRSDVLSRRLESYVTPLSEESTRIRNITPLNRPELRGSLRERLLGPMVGRLGSILGRLAPSNMVENLNQQLVLAGRPLGLGAREFYGIRLIGILVGFALAYYFLRQGLATINAVIALVSLYVGGYGPKVWLRRQVRLRQESIRRGLPDALDMLSVCATAGLGFDQSLQRVGEYWQTPIGQEFRRVVKEMEMGSSRASALRALAERVSIPEISSFVAVIIQSDQMGMSIADTLHAQAAQMRIERRYRAQEQARKMPLKMLFPMILLIFPAMMAIILGPVVPLLGEFFDSLLTGIQR